jgi:hypothetical protein
VALPDLLELRPVPFVDRRHALAEHAHHLVPASAPGGVEQARQQGEPLLLAHLPQVCRVQHPGLAREVRHLRRRHAVEPPLRCSQRVSPGEEGQVVPETRQRRRLRRLLQTIDFASPGPGLDLQQRVQLRPFRGGHPLADALEDPGVDLRPDAAANSSSVV